MRSIEVKTILNKKPRRDDWFLDDYTINLYSGCSFNCLYCYIRGSKYGINMEDTTTLKGNGLELLDKQLANRAKKEQYGFIVMASSTDPYLQYEKNTGVTREALMIILKHKFPVHVITKSPLVERDFDILHEINQQAILPADLQSRLKHKVFITFSFSTVDKQVAKMFEPSAPEPLLRLQALANAHKAGFTTGVSMMPLIPFISDTNESLHAMYAAFKKAKAHYVMPAGLSLFGEGPDSAKQLVFNAIDKHYPHLINSYRQLFSTPYTIKQYLQQLDAATKQMGVEYGLRNRIVL